MQFSKRFHWYKKADAEHLINQKRFSNACRYLIFMQVFIENLRIKIEKYTVFPKPKTRSMNV